MNNTMKAAQGSQPRVPFPQKKYQERSKQNRWWRERALLTYVRFAQAAIKYFCGFSGALFRSS